MNALLTHRLNQILPKITSSEFLCGSGIGNEIAFYIFDYSPEDELEIRKHIDFLREHIPKSKPNLKFIHINLFDFLLDYLKSRNLLDKALTLQREKGNNAFIKALKGVLHEEKIAKRFSEIAKPTEQNLVLISGVGAAFPLLRPHTLLNNLHSMMGQTPLLMFYPGKYDKLTLQLFGKLEAHYYRAFRLID
jgi:hypothetical protein